jgi:L-2,4-diaminobutyrate decarboxylase
VPDDRLDELQITIRRRVIESGAFYLVQTNLPSGVFLRVTLIHPLTVLDDLCAMLDALRSAARSQ